MYTVQVASLDKEPGCALVENLGLFANEKRARAEMFRAFHEELLKRSLENNGASDEKGNSIPGGYINNTEAKIYDFVGFDHRRLLEVVQFAIQEIKPRYAPLQKADANSNFAELASNLDKMALHLRDAKMPIFSERAQEAAKAIQEQADQLAVLQMLLGVELDNQEKLREINELLRAAEEGRVVVTSSRKKAKRLETLAKADSKGQCQLAPVKIGGVVYIVGPKLISCGERGTIRTLPKEKEVYSGIVTAIKFSNTEPTIVEVIETRTPVNHGVVSQCQRCCEYELGITCFASENEAKTHL